MDTTHEAVGVVLVQQMLTVSRENPAGITVVSEDTDVFVLLLHHYLEDGLTLLVTMESPIKDRIVVDIGKTVEKHQNIIPEILAAHALSGCDTVACCFGIGKKHCPQSRKKWILFVTFGPYRRATASGNRTGNIVHDCLLRTKM